VLYSCIVCDASLEPIVILSCIVCDTCLGLCVEFDTHVYYTEVVKQGASWLFEGNFTI